eukprot:TRINITY_DN1490_c0_g1_i5.p1 TRINITY_DN1490_c0_g1~~TRINITY_DN1490_c0_g1_i5.p1  ORF type:complete len:225 (+),score=61.06 TRINITY_DN1490_c0_g1_i5:257-931(+)
MGGKPQKPLPPQEVKTPQQLIKEHTRTINKLRREFQKEINQLEMNNQKIKKDMENMIKKKEPKNNVKIIAQSLLRNNNFITKYQRLDAQLGNMIFQLQATGATTTLVDVMKSMNQILGKVSNNIDINNIQNVIEQFTQQVDQHEALGEQISDMLNMNETEIEDAEVDKQIAQVEISLQGGGNNQGGMVMNNPTVNQNNNNLADIQQMEAQLCLLYTSPSPRDQA